MEGTKGEGTLRDFPSPFRLPHSPFDIHARTSPISSSSPARPASARVTVLRRLFERFPERLRLSVSATTRAPRPGEQEGVDYYFLSPEEFARRREAGRIPRMLRGFRPRTLVRHPPLARSRLAENTQNGLF